MQLVRQPAKILEDSAEEQIRREIEELANERVSAASQVQKHLYIKFPDKQIRDALFPKIVF